MKYSLTFSDLTADEARHLLAQAGGQAPAPGTAPAPAASVPAAPPPGASAPPPPPGAGAPPPPPPGAPAPAAPAPAPPPPAPAAGGVSEKVKQVTAAMQNYAKTHKSAGVKAVLAKCSLARVGDASDVQLDWLLSYFNSNAAP